MASRFREDLKDLEDLCFQNPKSKKKILTSALPKCSFFTAHCVFISSSFQIKCGSFSAQVAAKVNDRFPDGAEICLDLPSKSSMAADTLELLRDYQMSIKHVNPRQYVTQIPQVWFQQPKDIVWKFLTGDLDLGIAGFDWRLGLRH